MECTFENRNGLNHILKIIDGLILEQKNTEHLLTRLNTGSVEHRRKKKFEELDERITNIINEYSNEKIE